MAETKTGISIEEFERLAASSDARLELVGQEVIRLTPEHWHSGGLALRLFKLLEPVVGELGGELRVDVGFVLAQDPNIVRGPDLAYVSGGRLPPEPHESFFRGAPDLAVEIVSPNDSAADLLAKVEDHLGHGTRLVWVLVPRTRTVTVHHPDRTSRTLMAEDVLSGDDVLPGFEVSVARLFETG